MTAARYRPRRRLAEGVDRNRRSVENAAFRLTWPGMITPGDGAIPIYIPELTGRAARLTKVLQNSTD